MSGTIRVNKTENYSVISNIPLADSRLSWEARGVIAYLLSKPNNWHCRNHDLVKNGPAGGDKIERILDELQEYGYLIRIRRQNEVDKTFEWDTTVLESPVDVSSEVKARLERKKQRLIEKRQKAKAKQAIGGLSTNGLSTNGLSTNGKTPDIINTESTNTEIIKEHAQKILLDPLADILNRQGQTTGTLFDERPADQWFQYRDAALAIYERTAGPLGKTSAERQTRKEAILGLVADEGDKFDPARWQRAITESIERGCAPGNVSRFIEVYQAGSYATYIKQTYSKDKPEPAGTTIKTKDGGVYL